MDLTINNLTIPFPFPEPYPEQFNYMRFITEALDANDHAVISMHKAKGRGQTVAMLSVLVSYILSKPNESVKVLYCTKNAEQANKVMDTLKLVYNHCRKVILEGAPDILAVGFASRKELCINSNVVETSAENEDKMVAGCRKLTASWVREIAIEDACPFFKNAESTVLSPGIYSIEELVDSGKANGWCPYFVAKRALQSANIVVFGYENMLDPKFAGIISKEINSNSIVAFDNADQDGVEKFCTEALTIGIDKDTFQGAKRNMERLYQEIERVAASDEHRLHMEYEKLKKGLKDDLHPTDLWLANPALPEDLTVEPMPGHIRRPKHFLFHLDLLVWYLESKIGTKNKETETPLDFLRSFYFVKCPFNTNFLRFCDERLSSLLTTLKIVDTDEFLCIQKLCHFATLWGHYFELIDKFQISTGPCLVHYDEDGDPYYDPAVKLGCMDPSLVMKSVLNRFRSVCINLKDKPADTFTTEMNFEARVCQDIVPSRRPRIQNNDTDSEEKEITEEGERNEDEESS